jgi:hypothetical protein
VTNIIYIERSAGRVGPLRNSRNCTHSFFMPLIPSHGPWILIQDHHTLYPVIRLFLFSSSPSYLPMVTSANGAQTQPQGIRLPILTRFVNSYDQLVEVFNYLCNKWCIRFICSNLKESVEKYIKIFMYNIDDYCIGLLYRIISCKK